MRIKYIAFIIIFPVIVFTCFKLYSFIRFHPLRFKNEINKLVRNPDTVNKENLNLFAGSSSIRLWFSLEESFGGHNILNQGFGGSEMSDLIYYFDDLILPYEPSQIFVYEGDNDINSGKTPDQILHDADQLLSLIREKIHQPIPVLFISAKPSLSRAHLKEKYLAFNKALQEWTTKHENVKYIDVWTPMIDKDGNPLPDLFVEDGLHMNEKGYAIWKEVIGPYLK